MTHTVEPVVNTTLGFFLFSQEFWERVVVPNYIQSR